MKYFLIIAVFFTFFSCKNANIGNKDVVEIQKCNFNADSAYNFVVEQCAFGTRIPESKAHNDCLNYLVAKFKSYNATVVEQKFVTKLWNGKTVNGTNVIASYNLESSNRIFLSAHWDSRATADHDLNSKNHNSPIDGANDGASGVAVLLEIARQLSTQNPKMGVDIILFDMEDQGSPEQANSNLEDTWCLGSQYWAKNHHKAFYRASYGILLDMVATNQPLFTKEGTSVYFAKSVLNMVWAKAKQLGYGQIFSDEETNAILDDHYYINKIAHIPTIDIIHYEHGSDSHFFPHWHTVNDNISNINPQTMNIVGEVLLAIVLL